MLSNKAFLVIQMKGLLEGMFAISAKAQVWNIATVLGRFFFTPERNPVLVGTPPATPAP